MLESVSGLFDTAGFVPRAQCGRWTTGLIWLHIISDLLIWIAYVSIPIILLAFSRRKELPFPRVFVLFAMFILACGFGHLVEATIFFEPIYRFAGVLKAVTAAVSLMTVVALVPLARRLFALDHAKLLAVLQPNQSSRFGVRGVSGLITGVFVAAVLVLVANTAVSSININALIYNEELITHTRAVKAELNSLLSDMKDAETGHRGFQITGNTDYLAPFFEGTRSAQVRIVRLREITTDNPDQMQDGVTLQELILAKSSEMSGSLVVHVFHGRDAAHSRIATGHGKRLMDDIRATVAQMDAREDELLSARATESRNKYRATTVTSLLGGGLALAMVVLGYGMIRWELARRLLAENIIKQREAELARSEEKFRTLATAVPQIFWVAGPDGSREYYNAKWYEYTGMTEEQTLGFGWSLALHPEDKERGEAAWKQSVDTGCLFEIEYRIRGADGNYRWFLGRALPQRDASGTIIRWFGSSTDITERRTAEAAIRRSEERFRMLTEAAPLMVWTASTTGDITFFNRRWDEYTGMNVNQSSDTRKLNDWGTVIHPDDLEQLRSDWQLAVAHQPERFSGEFRLKRARDGAYRWMVSTAVSLRDASGAVSEWVGSITDNDDQKRQAENLEWMVRERTAALVDEVEERRAVEQKVREVAAELARSNAELEQFAYVASHDLQEPLRKIQAFGDRLRTKFRDQLPDGGKEYVDRMLNSAGRMRQLIDDLLSFSRVTSQTRPFVRVDLGKIVREVISDLSERIEQTHGDVRIGALPTIDADATQMRQLFQNLIANALKFQRPGVPPVVEVQSEMVTIPPGEQGGESVLACRLSVKDNGIGFDTKYLDRIFQVFQRLHGREEYEGTGVGLAICRKIAERHVGSITATSQVGEGATFTVTLPVRQLAPIPSSKGEIS